MKKNLLFITFIALFFITHRTYADSWDDFSNIDRMWDGQKSITNQEFEQVVEKLEEKGKQKEEKQNKKKRKKLFGNGTTLHSELNPDSNSIQELDSLQPDNEDVLVNIPVDIVIGDKILEKGYYKVLPEKNNEEIKVYINLYQSQFFKGKIEVTETEDDFDEPTLNFAKVLPCNESFIKIIFGSLDFNAYVYVPYVNQ